jgi:hypothetical protein
MLILVSIYSYHIIINQSMISQMIQLHDNIIALSELDTSYHNLF